MEKEGENVKWLKNLQSLSNNNDAGQCPFCNSDNTDSAVNVVDDKTMMGYGAIWCNDCKKAFHISRIKISKDMKIKEIPKDLTF